MYMKLYVCLSFLFACLPCIGGCRLLVYVSVKFPQIVSTHINFLFPCRSSQATLTPVT